jgi:biotin carboxylase
VREVVAKALAALGISNGTVTCDIVVHEGEPFVVELTTGLSGGFFCTREFALNTGVDLVDAAIKIALGEPVGANELTPKHSAPVVQRYAFAEAGEVVSIAGVEAARRIAGVSDIIVTAKPGDVIATDGDKRKSAAMVLTTGNSHEEALRAANDAIACLKISVR